MYGIEKIHEVLRCYADGSNIKEAAISSKVGLSAARKWVNQFKVNRNSFLSDQEIYERIGLYSDKKTVEIPEPEPFVNRAEPPKKASMPSPPDDDELPAGITDMILPEEEEKPTTFDPKKALSPADQNKLAHSIRLTLGDKAMNDVHNGVVALISGVAERIKEVDNHEDAIRMVSSAIALKQLLEVLEAPPMAMNWNEVYRIYRMLGESNNLFDKKVVEKNDTKDAVPTQVNVTILSQKPPKRPKTIDAEICDT